MDLELILTEVLPLQTDAHLAKLLLVKYHLLQPIAELKKRIIELESSEKDPKAGTINLGVLSLSIEQSLVEINSIVGSIENVAEKYFIKSAIGKIYNNCIKRYILPSMTVSGFEEWVVSMKYMCENRGYNFQDLESMLNLNDIRVEIITKNQRVLPQNISKQKYTYLEWISLKVSFDVFSKKLMAKDYIKSTKEFKSFFSKLPVDSIVHFNEKYFEEIFVLFLVMEESEWVQCRGTKGIWAVLKQKAVDFSGNPFIKKESKRYKDILKRNENKWLQLKRNADLILNSLQT